MNQFEKEAYVDELVDKAIAAKLFGTEIFAGLTLAQVAAAYNGIGPEWLSEDLRQKATDILSLFEPAAVIHDVEFASLDVAKRSIEHFHAANNRFLTNCMTLADRKYSWWQWRRYRARIVALALYDFVNSVGGFAAYVKGCQENKKEHV